MYQVSLNNNVNFIYTVGHIKKIKKAYKHTLHYFVCSVNIKY